jgi:hypothetical protein
MPVHDRLLADACERRLEPSLGRALGQDLLVRPRRAVAEEDGAEPVDVEHDGLR